MTQLPDADRRRARALAELDAQPPETDEERVQRIQVERRSTALVSVLFAATVGLWVVTLVLDGGFGGPDEVPVWRLAAVVGLLALSGVAFWILLRPEAARRNRDRLLPLQWLTGEERGHLLRQARGRAPVVPEDLPLSRLTARVRLTQRLPVARVLASAPLFALHAIMQEEALWDVVFVGVLCVLVAVHAYERRQAAHPRAFLDRHPDPRVRP